MISLDITGVLARIITPTRGVPGQEFKMLENTIRNYVADFVREREAGGHEWSQSPYDEEVPASVRELSREIRGMNIDTVLWVGIGGSGLGPRVVKEVFEGVDTPELVIVDTVDPSVISEEIKIIDWKRTVVVVTSKSGGTLEPMSVFLLMEKKLKDALGEGAAKHIVAVTDPKDGELKAYADSNGYAALPIASGVGGRYSIFTPVGLLPLAVLGADVEEFLRGARDMDEVCKNTAIDENPAARLAASQFLLETKRNYVIRVVMPYSARLQSLGRWEQQLIAESLGKTETFGPSPMAGIGTQDQHSMLQQWIQGKRNAWHIFIREQEKEHVTLPDVSIGSLSYLSGKGLGQIMDALYEGTARSLTAAKRPHVTITLPRIDEYHLGQLFFLFMAEVVFLGKLYRVNPYGQPGVEMGKKIAKEILSRGR